MVLRYPQWLIVAVLAACLTGGCNDAPSTVGAEFLPDTSQLRVLSSEDTLLIEATFTERIAQPLFNTGILYLGRVGNLEARTLLRFTDIPETLATVSPDQILSATLILTPQRYALGDTSSGATFVPFRIHKVLRLWTPQATWDSLFAAGDAGILDPVELGQWDAPIPLQDTVEPVRVELSSAGRELLAEWFRWQADSTLRQQIYGIALVPSPGAQAVRAFSTQAIGQLTRPAPMLEVVYRRSPDQNDTLRLTAGYAGSFLSPVAADTSQYLVLQPGIAYRPALSIRLDALPALAALHRAELRLPLDTAACWTGNRERSRFLILTPADSGAPSWLTTTATYDATSGAYISKSIAPMLEYWLRRSRRGKLLITLQGAELYGHLDRLTLRRLGSAVPELILVYSERPQP
ncbi:hypothetical protein HRbin21_00824 [bacterium HR21]|jgi:hypothetical protein|nr:hypothetical protein HRbin21_00824 [bacterium HR21]